MIVVTHNSIVGYLIKAYDVVGTGYYHIYAYMIFLVFITDISVPNLLLYYYIPCHYHMS